MRAVKGSRINTGVRSTKSDRFPYKSTGKAVGFCRMIHKKTWLLCQIASDNRAFGRIVEEEHHLCNAPRAPPPQRFEPKFKSSEEYTVYDKKSDYALNKLGSDAIVYKSVTGTYLIKREDFSSDAEFRRWKEVSDRDYQEIERSQREENEVLCRGRSSGSASASR